PRGPYLVGMGLRAQGKSTQAKQEFEAAIALAPGYVEPLIQLVDMALLEKQPDAALNRVTKQIGLAPNSGRLQQLLGMLYLARRETRLAEGAFLKAIELEPRLIESYLRLGNLYRESGRDNEALAKFEEALKVQPQNISALMLLAVLYEGKGQI